MQIQHQVKQVGKNIVRCLGKYWKMYQCWSERAQQRRQLARMPDYLLKDIGLSRIDANQEAEKPFWKA